MYCILNCIYINTYIYIFICIIYYFIYIYIYIYISTARSRGVSESHLKAELCFHRYLRFTCVPMYGFGFLHKQCASD